MHGTDASGRLKTIPDCWIKIGQTKIELNNLPDLGDSKGANYNDEPGVGRSLPIKTYGYSESRAISCSISLFVQSPEDPDRNLRTLRTIQAAVYPREGGGAPYFPPIVCQIKCGKLLSSKPLCVVLRNYDVKFPTDVPWDEETLCPYKLDISMSFEEVRSSSDLPGYEQILGDI